jgi:uncharacterized membrane protein
MGAILAAVVMAFSALGLTQTAPQGLSLYTVYPSRVVRSGATVDVTVQVQNNGLPTQDVQLSAEGVPDGWSASFLGGGLVVQSVSVQTDKTENVSLKVELPEQAADGSYSMTVVAKSEAGQASLPVSFTVGQTSPTRISLTPNLPVLKGSPKSSFNYRLTVKNDSDEDLLVNFDSQVPDGFQINFTQAVGSQEITSLPVKAGQSQDVNADLTLPTDVAAGSYDFQVGVQAKDASAQVKLSAVITGQSTLKLTTPDSRLSANVTAGKTTALKMVLENTGSAPATGVQFSSSPPTDWKVTFDPATIDSLPPGQQVNVTANVQVPDNVISGDYMVTMTSKSNANDSQSADFRLTVQTSTLWGITGLVLIAIALGVVALAVMRFGRR